MAEVTPIRETDDRSPAADGRGPVTKELQGLFFDAVHGRIDRYGSWLSPVTGGTRGSSTRLPVPE